VNPLRTEVGLTAASADNGTTAEPIPPKSVGPSGDARAIGYNSRGSGLRMKQRHHLAGLILRISFLGPHFSGLISRGDARAMDEPHGQRSTKIRIPSHYNAKTPNHDAPPKPHPSDVQ
jgi:hypothetical protein